MTRPISPKPIDTRNVGTGKTLTPAGTVNDGNSGANYAVTFANDHDRCHHSAGDHGDRRGDQHQGYDGTTASVTMPTITTGSLASGDTAGFSETFDTRNVGTGKTLTPAGIVNDGNGGGNYTVTFANANLGTITTRAITVKAGTDSRVYDGTTASAVAPTISVGTLAAGDTAVFTQSFDNRNVASGKTLTPAGSVNDGNNGANYAVTFSAVNTGVITALPITVTAVSDTKVYDGTTSSAGIPGIGGSLGTGDTAAFTQAFGNRNAGTGKTLVPSGVVADGNGGANYSVTFVNNTTGSITARPLAVTAASSTKGYDGTTASATLPADRRRPGLGRHGWFLRDFRQSERRHGQDPDTCRDGE